MMLIMECSTRDQTGPWLSLTCKFLCGCADRERDVVYPSWQVLLQSFATLSLQLWNDITGELAPLKEQDILLFNWGAWYHRFCFAGGPDEFNAWKASMEEVILQRMVNMKCTVIWKGYTTFHYAGAIGASQGCGIDLQGPCPWHLILWLLCGALQ